MTTDRTRWFALFVLCCGPDDRPRRDDRERRAALDPRGPRLLRVIAGLGRQRLPAHLRRLPAAGRPARRSLRPPPALHRRNEPLHPRIAGLRAPRSQAFLVPPAPCRVSAARRLGRLARADHDALHVPGIGRKRWASSASSPRVVAASASSRRRAHRPSELALDLPGQLPVGALVILLVARLVPADRGSEAGGAST